MESNILNEFSSSDRHKIIILRCRPEELRQAKSYVENLGVPIVNVGLILAQKITELTNEKHLGIELQEFLTRSIETNSKLIQDDNLEIISVYNLGVLLEPDLGLDPRAIIKDISRRIGLVVIWQDEITPPAKLHWKDGEDTHFIDLSDIPPLKVKAYEI